MDAIDITFVSDADEAALVLFKAIVRAHRLSITGTLDAFDAEIAKLEVLREEWADLFPGHKPFEDAFRAFGDALDNALVQERDRRITEIADAVHREKDAA